MKCIFEETVNTQTIFKYYITAELHTSKFQTDFLEQCYLGYFL